MTLATSTFPGNSLYVFDGDRPTFGTSSHTMIRVFNNTSIVPEPSSYTTMSVVNTRQFFSWTGCSYSLNAVQDSPVGWSLTCGSFTFGGMGGITQDNSTVYVFGSYVSDLIGEQPPGTLLYWGLNPGTNQSVPLAPDKLSYLFSDSKLDIDANPEITPLRPRSSDLSITEFYVPLLPNEDFYQVLQTGSTSQYQSNTGFGNWPNASGLNLLSMTSASFIGAYSYQGSYSTFSFLPGQFIMYSSLSGSNTNPGEDNLYFCAGTLCSSIAADSGGVFRMTDSQFWLLDNADLLTTYSLLKGGTAFYSLTQFVSSSFIGNPFSMNYDHLGQNIGKGLVYGENIGAVLPKENITFLHRTTSLFSENTGPNYKSAPYYYKIPSVINPGLLSTNSLNTTFSARFPLTYSITSMQTIPYTFVREGMVVCDNTFNAKELQFTMSFSFSSPVSSWGASQGWTMLGPGGGRRLSLLVTLTDRVMPSPNLTLSFGFPFVPDYPTITYFAPYIAPT
jgi:hypothetical protein